MSTKENETPLTSNWLNDREKFDLEARNKSILEDFLQTVKQADHVTLADVGCGTGTNALFLSQQIDSDITWYLVERESYLLEEAKKRVLTRFPDTIQKSSSVYESKSGRQIITFNFLNETLDIFLERNINLTALTASALFDLFTQQEFQKLLDLLVIRKIPLYSVLNYEGLTIQPAMEEDQYYIKLFESHMSRELEKGFPMGQEVMVFINEMAKISSHSINCGVSNWEIHSNERSFLLQNFWFYEHAIIEVISDENEKQAFNNWLNQRKSMIENSKLSLTVKHQDFFIYPE